MPVILVLGSALAADLVWLDAPSPSDRARVAALPGVTGERSPDALRGAATDVRPSDDDAYRRLDETLVAVRAYESKLDGEVVIMDDLQTALDAITVVPEPSSRDVVFRALAYQGFAVQRYYADALGEDPSGEPWRAALGGEAAVRPWVDAVALIPDRDVTPYDIAEAPQRVAFGQVRTRVLDALPGGLRVTGLPKGAELVVDGSPRPSDGATLRVPPGRHYVHVRQGGAVMARWTVDLAPGATEALAFDDPSPAWDAFLAGLSEGSAVPGPVQQAVTAVGGEIWLARTGSKGPEVFRVTPTAVSAVELPKDAGAAPERGGLSVSAGIWGGWLSSGDFYTQAPDVAPRERSTVNAVTLVPNVGLDLDVGMLRVGAGFEMPWHPGEHHVALTGAARLAVRPTPHVWMGLPWIQGTVGYVFPYHPMVGGRAAVPLPAGLEARGEARVGLPSTRTRADDTTYDTLPLVSAGLGLAIRR